MVAIARAIGFEAKLVIMDEPTSSLDEREVAVLFDVIRQLKSEGVSVIFVSHKLDELYEVCDRVTIMRDGRTVRTADMASISKLELVASMLGRDIAQVAKSATAFGDRRVARMTIGNGEGNYFADAATLDRLEGEGQVVFRYQQNPNGSARAFAGIVNDGGNILGLMPHPDRASEEDLGSADGAAVFQSVMASA